MSHEKTGKGVYCRSGKAPLAYRRDLDGIAASFARQLNRSGRYAESLYGYRCGLCEHFHLTRRAQWRGTANFLLHRAAPRALQEWAMPEGPQEPVPPSLAE